MGYRVIKPTVLCWLIIVGYCSIALGQQDTSYHDRRRTKTPTWLWMQRHRANKTGQFSLLSSNGSQCKHVQKYMRTWDERTEIHCLLLPCAFSVNCFKTTQEELQATCSFDSTFFVNYHVFYAPSGFTATLSWPTPPLAINSTVDDKLP